MKRVVLFFLCFSIYLIGKGQDYSYFYSDSLTFIDAKGDTLAEPFSGGLNNSQFNSIDINLDNIPDLMVFDSKSKSIKTYINKGGYGKINYQYYPDYEQYFPKFTNWVLARDYNCDGKMDLFYGNVDAVGVYKNTSTSTELRFELYTDRILSNHSYHVYSPLLDIPAIDDIDGDGDLDFLAFSSIGSPNYYSNRRIEDGLDCDSLVLHFMDNCWGSFTESSSSNTVFLSAYCGDERYYKRSLHAGSSLLTLDMDEDGDKELILGDPGFPDLKILENGKADFNYPYDTIVGSTNQYPSGHPVDITAFPAAYYLDINNDGVKDLLVSNLDQEFSSDLHQNWIYLNRNKTDHPDFEFEDSSFLQRSSIDLGSISKPYFFDIDGDGDEDLLISSNGSYSVTQGNSDRVTVYERKSNSGEAYFEFKEADWQNLSSLNIRDMHLCFGDLNKDGLPDLFIGKQNGYLSYLKNTGSLTSPAFTVVTDSFFQISGDKNSAPFLFDMDEDDDLDLLLGDNHGKINYYINNGSATISDFNSQPSIQNLGNVIVNDTFYNFDINNNPVLNYKPEGYSTPTISDLNKDGNPELIVGSHAGYIHIYEFNRHSLNSPFTEITDYFAKQKSYERGIVSSGRQAVAACNDVNGDSIPDIIIGNISGGLQFLSSIPGQRDSLVVNSVGGVKELNFHLYPNPGKNRVTIQFAETSSSAVTLEILDITGKSISTTLLDIRQRGRHELDVHQFKPGIYWVYLHANHLKPLTKRLIILK